MRGFSDDERDAIRRQLVETGRRLFVRYGPEKTNVADITDEVGIAKGTFYRFFDSKSALYFEIFTQERDEFLAEVEAALRDIDDPETAIVCLFDHYLTWIEESPLLQRLVVDSTYTTAFRDLPAEELERTQREAMAELRPFFEAWRETGDLRAIEFDLFLGLLGAVGLVTLHHEEFDQQLGPDRYEEIRNTLIETVARGLTR
ncbi:TetR/AcrR family transcriptional regulator [Halorarius litoreus]|uniref:TetR/AcrR family transcriptional regulator n=1 Tax=Halorarius litoreus TaxID=2962676 RepID=UPI0020CC8FBD|nr:TetR/AcrR family transcriptional regulator [Halorarius litoreus]